MSSDPVVPRRSVNWRGIALGVLFLGVSAILGKYGQPYVHGNEEARSVIVNVFSILAGFLITVMTLLGEPGLFRSRTWRADAARRENMHRRLLRHKLLFLAYLTTLGLIFGTTIVAKRYPESDCVVWLERIYLAMAVLAFLCSLILPSKLMSLQLAKYDAQIEARKQGKDPE
jgi:hypothetical protein